MRRHEAATLALLLAVGLTACGSATYGPHPRGPGEGTAAAPEVVERYAADVLLSVHTSGGMGAPGKPVPDYEVRTDGTVFLSTDDGLGVDTLTLTEAGLEEVRERFAEVSMRGDDYDESDWTDQPVTTVYATLGGRPESIGIYGFGHDDDVDDDDWDRLEDAIGFLQTLADTTSVNEDVAVPSAPYRPAEVALLLAPTEDSAAEDWPFTQALPRTRPQGTRTAEACIVLRDADVATLADIAADEGPDDLTFATGRPPRPGVPETVEAEIRPILRGTPGPCSDRPSGDRVS